MKLNGWVVAGLSSVAVVTAVAASGNVVKRAEAVRERQSQAVREQEALRQRNQQLIAIELQLRGRHEVFERQWLEQLRRLDTALDAGDTRVAASAWREAYSIAARTGPWQDLIEVGDRAVRLGRAPEARTSYLKALHRAEALRSVDGVLRVADAFGALGDREVADNCLVIAGRFGYTPLPVELR